MDYWDKKLRKAVRALIPDVEGKPCVNFGDYDGGVYVCRRISGLHVDEDSFNGQCEWVDPEDARPGELTDGMSISCACVEVGPGWWHDTYFGWYFVYEPTLVARSLAGDHSWVQPFLDANRRPTPVPVPATKPPGLSHHLQPKEGRPILKTEEVVQRLHTEFVFFSATPQQCPGECVTRVTQLTQQKAPWAEIEAALPGRDFTYSVILSDEMDTIDYLNFVVRPNEGLLINYRDEPHKRAVTSLVERCARLLDYDAVLQ